MAPTVAPVSARLNVICMALFLLGRLETDSVGQG